MTTKTPTPTLTDVHDPHGRVIPTSLPDVPAPVADVAERLRQAVAHELEVDAEYSRIAKALTSAPNADARAAMANPDAPRTEPALKAELDDAQAAVFAARQNVSALAKDQHAAIRAAGDEWLEQLLAGIREDRDAIVDAIEALDQAFRALARREDIIARLQRIQAGDDIWNHLPTIDRVTEKQRAKAAAWIEQCAGSARGLPADLQDRPLMLEALRWHASATADGQTPEAKRLEIKSA